MVDTIPQWIAKARTFLGVEEKGGAGDNPTILGFIATISAAFPAQARYAANYTSDDIAWCGVFADRCLVEFGISGPYDPRDELLCWMWAAAWRKWGKPSDPRVGAIVCFDHHVAFVNRLIDDDNFEAIGGNQSSPQGGAVTLSRRRWGDVIACRWPDVGAVVVAPPPDPMKPFVPLDQQTINAITTAAARSDLARYSWRDRGVAPIGYIKGVAVTYGMALRRLAARDSTSFAMTRVVDGDGDVFDHYSDILLGAGMVTLDAPDIDRLRYLWVILTGLGMRESSGNYSEGRDVSASNTSADTAEAGLFQMSWNASATSQEIPALRNAYAAGNYPGHIEIFREGVAAKLTDTFGSGEGAQFQILAKTRPAFAVEAAAIGMRTLYTHWGPLVRQEAEVVPAADALFRQVQTIVAPLDGEVLPPKFDNEILIALILVLFEGTDMDATLKAAMLAELQKPNPDFRTLLLQALGGAPGLPPPVIPTPPVVIPPAAPAFDPTPYMPLLQRPLVQKILGNITAAELFSLIPEVVAISQGKPPSTIPGPVVVTPPVVLPPGQNNANNWSAGIAAALAALGLGGSGLIGMPVGPDYSVTGLISVVAPLVMAGIAPWAAPFLSGLFGKKTP